MFYQTFYSIFTVLISFIIALHLTHRKSTHSANGISKSVSTVLQPVADINWGPLAQWLTSCQEKEQNSVNVASSTPVQPPGTLFHLTFVILLIPKTTQECNFWSCLQLTILLAFLDEPYSGAYTNLALVDWLMGPCHNFKGASAGTLACNVREICFTRFVSLHSQSPQRYHFTPCLRRQSRLELLNELAIRTV